VRFLILTLVGIGAAACGGLVACRSSNAIAPGQGPGILHPEGCVGNLPPRAADAPIASAYRFEVELWEMPLSRAAELYRAGDPIHSSIAVLIDERGLAKPLAELAAIDSRVQRVDRSEFTASPGTRGLMPARVGGPDRSLWCVGLRLDLGGAATTGWAADALDFACTWKSPQGERLATANGSTPMPDHFGVLVWCLPGKALAELPEPRDARAVLALVRVIPQF
jgi:hypothetical protein